MWGPDNYCSVLDCNAPGAFADICGPDATCLVIFPSEGAGDTPDLGTCLKRCASADECNTNQACVTESLLVDTGSPLRRVCFPLCTLDRDCRSGQRCTITEGTEMGRCE
jgi:hypothetical protein